MKFTGRLISVNTDWQTGKNNIVFSVNEFSALKEIDAIKDVEVLDITARKHRKKRSLDANACLWFCIGEMSKALNADKWEIYLRLLRRYGKYTYIVVKEKAAADMKRYWRECEEIGTVDIHGEKAVQMLCYFGSSSYDSKEMSDLIEGAVSEMKEMGLEPPLPATIREAIDRWKA